MSISRLLRWLPLGAAACLAWPACASDDLGVGTTALGDRDLTDTDGISIEACVTGGQSPLACGWNAHFSGNNEPFFEGGEGAFNVFDNQVGAGNAKWCCDPPSSGGDDPDTAEDETGSIYVQATFAQPFVLHAFTLATGNDTQPGRDADIFKIQGSVDGLVYNDIYSYSNDGTSPFRQVNQVLLFRAGQDYPTPPAYRFFRYRAFSTVGGSEHHLNEWELFEASTTPQTLTAGGACSLHDAILAANRALPVGGCAAGSHGPDVIELGEDVTLGAGDAGIDGQLVDHATHASTVGGGLAGLPDVVESLTLRAGDGARIAREASLPCVNGDFSAFRLFSVFSGFTLQDITLENGCIAPVADTAQGGGLYATGTGEVALLGVTLRGHRALGAPGGDAADGGIAEGGALWIGSAGLTIQDSRIEDNLAESGSGASTFFAFGGALRSRALGVVIRDTRFERNTVANGTAVVGSAFSAGGGAADFSDGGILIERTLFRDNQVYGGDGALAGGQGSGGALRSLVPLTLRDVWFDRNEAAGGNGAVAGGNGSGGAVWGNLASAERVTLSDNLARSGGGPNGSEALGGGMSLNSTQNAFLHNLTLSGNRAVNSASVDAGTTGGGGLHFNSPRTYFVRHLTAIDNAARLEQTSGANQPFGGALAVGAGAEVRLSHVLMKQNVAQLGSNAIPNDCQAVNPGGVLSLGLNRAESPGLNCDLAAANDVVGVSVPTHDLGDHGCVATLPGGDCLPTVPLAAGSNLALDSGSCIASNVNQDARGAPRPVDLAGLGDGVDDCDIGAFEASDSDGDGVLDHADNCPSTANPAQEDLDNDGLGDACDACRSSYTPAFTAEGPYRVAPETAVGVVFGTLDADNGGAIDEGIGYAITGGSGAALFQLGADSGDLALAVATPAAGSYTLDVSATDCAGSASTIVTIEVLPLPIFGNGFEG